MTDKALEAALPGEAEVVGKIEAIIEAYDADVADAWNSESGERPDLWTPEVDVPVGLPREALASLQAMQARAEKAERERDHWKANHAEMVQRNAVLRERPDLPADRLPSIARYEARVKELEAENARLRRLDAEYGRVETAIIMADPDFDGDSSHDNCGDRLIASVHRLRDLTALKGGSNG